MRIVHSGFAALTLHDDDGRRFAVDPHDDPGPVAAILVSGGPWAERHTGVEEAVRAGFRGPVVAPEGLHPWLQGLGASPLGPPCAVGRLEIDVRAYVPKEPTGADLDRLRAALLRPGIALDRYRVRTGLPSVPPVAWRLGIASGHGLVHLGLALHSDTSTDFLDALAPWVASAENTVAGYAHGEEEAFVAHIARLAPKRLLLTDQGNDLRKAAALPVELLTPTRDALTKRGIETHVLVAGTSVRFEPDDTVKSW